MDRFLDASALLAFLYDEPGADRVLESFNTTPMMLTINLAEVATKLVRDRADATFLRDRLLPFPLQLIEFERSLAIDSALLEPLTRSRGLSVADRACLAACRQFKVPALTSDRAWAEVADAVGVTVELIR